MGNQYAICKVRSNSVSSYCEGDYFILGFAYMSGGTKTWKTLTGAKKNFQKILGRIKYSGITYNEHLCIYDMRNDDKLFLTAI